MSDIPARAPQARLVARATARCRALFRKARRAWIDGTLGSKLRRRASNSLYVPLRTVVDERRLPLADRALDLQTGFADHRRTDRELRVSDGGLRRIVDAFIAAETRRGESPDELEVRGLWAEWLDLNYSELRRLLRVKDISGLRALLENVHREPLSTGVGGTIDDTNRLPGWLGRAYYRVLWCRARNALQSVRPDWGDLASPVAGNPAGVWIDERLVSFNTLRHSYYATELLKLLGDRGGARIVEIGGGMGGQATQLLDLGGSAVASYTIVDLPEVACLSAYCLMATIGEDGVRLFGEAESSNGARVKILPPWGISTLPDRCADLVVNTYSFSEMDSSTATFYLREVERLADRWFFHVNHETRFRYRQPDGSISENRIGSEMIPDRQLFHLRSRCAARFVRPENRANRAFEYIYCRTAAAIPGRMG